MSGTSAILKMVCVAMVLMRGVVSPAFANNSGSSVSRLREASPVETLHISS